MDNSVQKLPPVPPFYLLLIFKFALLGFMIPNATSGQAIPFIPNIDSQTRNFETESLG